MPVKHIWTRGLPEGCELEGVGFYDEWIEFRLYCRDEMRMVRIDFLSGKTSIRSLGEPELRGSVEHKREFHSVFCYKGLKRRVWNRIIRGLNVKMKCRKDICVVAVVQPNYNLEIQTYSGNGDLMEKIGLGKVYHFDVVASENLIAVTSAGFTEEGTATVLFDGSTGTVIDYYTGFGGYAVASPEMVFIIGKQEERTYTRGYNNDGEEMIHDEGVPVLAPFNPIPHQIDGMNGFQPKIVALMDRHEIKIYNTIDYSIDYTVIRPPFTRGVFHIDEYNAAVLSMAMGKTLIINYDLKGRIKWASHLVRDLRYAVISSNLVAMYVQRNKKGETRLYSISGNILKHEESFGPNAMPIIARRSHIVLTDGRVVAAYAME